MLLSRRQVLSGAVAAFVGGGSARGHAHNSAGRVEPPETPPDLRLTLEDQRPCRLRERLAGRVTAVQMMFTSCQATCPIQGAIFSQSAHQLGDQAGDAQWLSLSIDPATDDPAALRAWLGRFGAHPRWHAGRPDARDLDPFLDFLKARAAGADRHTAQVYFFDRGGRLAMRSVDFPPVGELVRVMKALDGRAP